MYPNNPAPVPNPPACAVPAGQWTTGLCDCFDDPGNCCITFCCPCVTFGQNAEVIDKGTTSCGVAGFIYYALANIGCSCLYTFSYRSKLRGLYSLQEAPCGDLLIHCCCLSCALCQEYRELKNRGVDPSIGWQANAEKWNRTGGGGIVMAPIVAPGMAR
ncbi:PREDICTED: cell number regulator 2-like [Nelumbo nucifera]|uniref:Cell number regulator 2-like n=2 Tax=Nelumbo nucifera TaxID=4432 RepID=A0A1U8AR50_NELNU|nr:PREDICTED: cell number regulator 2-like [Nelumbo nucifera]DAD31734.1 TPA_asm: hypothetical protein HUJ06_010585 [Nelumbo nucifera]